MRSSARATATSRPQCRARYANNLIIMSGGPCLALSPNITFLYEVNELKHCDICKLMSEDLYFCAAPDNWPLPTPPGKPVAFSDIHQLDLILPSPNDGLRQTIERHSRTLSKPLNVIIEMDSLTQIKELVMRGSGYTILAPAAA